MNNVLTSCTCTCKFYKSINESITNVNLQINKPIKLIENACNHNKTKPTIYIYIYKNNRTQKYMSKMNKDYVTSWNIIFSQSNKLWYSYNYYNPKIIFWDIAATLV